MPQRLQAHKVRIYPDADQRLLLAKTFGSCRFIYNLALEQRTIFGRKGRRISYSSWASELKALKEAAPFLSEVPHHCVQQALRDLDIAFARFFDGASGFPKPRRKFDNQSCRFPDPLQFRIERTALVLPKLGRVRMVAHRPIQGQPRSITVVREGDHYYASILVKVRVKPAPERPVSEGAYDVGVAQPVVEADGTKYQMPLMTVQEQRRKARLHKNVSRKQKGSKNRAKARRDLARFEAKIARRRRAAAHHISRRLVDKHTHLACEDLKLKNMTASAKGTLAEPGRNVRQKAGLNRAILDVAPGTIRMMVAYKTAWAGGVCVAVNPQGTSQTCAACGHQAAESRKNRDWFECVGCGHQADADVNAARNILARGRLHWTASKTTAPGPGVAARGALCSKARRRSGNKDPEPNGLPKAA